MEKNSSTTVMQTATHSARLTRRLARLERSARVRRLHACHAAEAQELRRELVVIVGGELDSRCASPSCTADEGDPANPARL